MPAALSARLVRSIPAAVFLIAVLFTPPLVAGEALTVDGLTFVNKGLVGVGRIPANQRDTFGETFGSGSGLAADTTVWKKTADGYSGTIYLLPDADTMSPALPIIARGFTNSRSPSSRSPTRPECPTRTASTPSSRPLPTPSRLSTQRASR
jgi:hypothetical protein